MPPRKFQQTFRIEDFHKQIQTEPCFICRMVADRSGIPHHIIYEDDFAIVFLDKYPTLYGHTIVAPKEHREQVTGDFAEAEYLKLQQLVYRVGQAARKSVPTERLYICSLGSQQAVSHVHWHVVPLPPGVLFAQQQCASLNKRNGVLDLSEEERADLAHKIRQAMQTF